MRSAGRSAVIALALGLVAPGRVHAEGAAAELEFGVAYSSANLVGLALHGGIELGKPVLGLCYIQPTLQLELDLNSAAQLTGIVRCNFLLQPGNVWWIGAGAGFGTSVSTDSNGNAMATQMSFRSLEVGYKIGGKRRFGIEVSYATDHTAGDANVLVLKLMLGRATP